MVKSKKPKKFFFIFGTVLSIISVLIAPFIIIYFQNNNGTTTESQNPDEVFQWTGTIVNGNYIEDEQALSEEDMMELEKSAQQEAEEIDKLLENSVVSTEYSSIHIISEQQDEGNEDHQNKETASWEQISEEEIKVIDIPDVFLWE